MSTLTEGPKVKRASEDDARQSEAQAQRSRGTVFTLSVAVVALGVLVAGLVALELSGGIGRTTTTTVMPMNGVNGGMNGMGAANGSAASSTGNSSIPVVSSTLGEYWIRPNMTSVPAGKIEFTARNVGQVEHELMVEPMPIKMDAPGQPNEDAAQGMIQDMAPGESGKMTLNLKPGMYMLFCNVQGHFAAGQYTTLRVTGS